MTGYLSPLEHSAMGAPVTAGIVDDFKLAMRQLAGAVTIITSGQGDERRGLTATAFCSVCASPPTVLVCINRSAEAHSFIALGGAFCVNVVASQDRSLADRFAAMDGSKGVVRFEGRSWSSIVTGAPALDDAAASFDCRVTETFDTETHTVFIGRVCGVRANPETKPLIYFDRRYRDLSDIPA